MTVDAVLVGAGLRGRFVYGRYARKHPDRLRIVAVAEPDPARRSAIATEHAIDPASVFDDWRALLERPRLAPAAIIATGDTLHVAPALAALERGYHVLLEKPIAPDASDCARIVSAAERRGRLLQIGHVLRYTEFYARAQQIVASGRLGRISSIDLQENVAYWHYAHSYVRGKFRNRKLAAPIVLAKSCHDLDLMIWLAGARPTRVSSFGSVTHFRADRAPAGTPLRCSDGCPVQATCAYDAEAFYATPDERAARFWPYSDLTADPSRDARSRALATGPYGVCVYHADNDVPDHQVVAVEFENGVAATFTMNGVASDEKRTIHIAGSAGELRGVLHEGWIEVSRHGTPGVERTCVGGSPRDHFGGDGGLLDHFTDLVARERLEEMRAAGRIALESHLLGFAAEDSRLGRCVVEMDAFRRATDASRTGHPGTGNPA
jgi:predicted dehydrogenase